MKILQKPSNLFLFALPGVSIICGFCIGYILLQWFYIGDYPVITADVISEPSEIGWGAAATIATFSIGWVFYQKRVSLFWSIFFLPLPVSTLLVHIFDAYEGDLIFTIAYYSVLLWGIGWLILLWLITKRVSIPVKEIDNEKSESTHVKWSKADLMVFVSILLVIGFGVLAGNSYSGIDIGYSEYETKIADPDANISVCFEYPVCFQKNIRSDNGNCCLDIDLIRTKSKLFNVAGYTSINITILEKPDNVDIGFSETSDSTILDTMLLNNSYLNMLKYKISVNDTGNITISGIQAEFIVSSFQGFLGSVWGIDGKEYSRYVYFEYGDRIWQISMWSIGLETDRHVEFFDRLLETITITTSEEVATVLPQQTVYFDVPGLLRE